MELNQFYADVSLKFRINYWYYALKIKTSQLAHKSIV